MAESERRRRSLAECGAETHTSCSVYPGRLRRTMYEGHTGGWRGRTTRTQTPTTRAPKSVLKSYTRPTTRSPTQRRGETIETITKGLVPIRRGIVKGPAQGAVGGQMAATPFRST